ncbi:ATP-grasp domain-containing protein [Patescibacteria group bacterium]|nr:ATP-grasp domain-containing protein [Patescibacteria group bacterium]
MSYKGILGMNARNLKYIRPNNLKSKVQIVDDKYATKELLKKHGIPVPLFYGVVGSVREFENFNFNKLPQNFVIKPNRGFGGGGILVLKGKEKKEIFQKRKIEKRKWLDSDSNEFTFEMLKSHILDIIDGKFSLSNQPDTALIERKVVADKELLSLCGKGVPDIRVVVFNNVPVMAMLRLPTIRSGGRANLFQGALGVGVDIASGEATAVVVKTPRRQLIDTHPDTGKEIIGFVVPFWEEILKIAVESQLVTGLGFLGVDIVVDRKQGPVVLELNARPGLEIQTANLEGMQRRLERVKGLDIKTVEKGIRVGQELFGGDIERRVEDVSGKEVVGIIEEVTLLNASGNKKIKELAKIDTGAESTSIDLQFAEKKLGFKEVVKTTNRLMEETEEEDPVKLKKILKRKLAKEDSLIEEFAVVRSSHGITVRPCVKVVFYLAGKKKTALANLKDRAGLKYQLIIGKRDLRNFLVDPGKKPKKVAEKP